MFKKILVGLDGSPRQEAVVAQACELARLHSACVTLCRAVQIPRSIPAVAWALKGDAFAKFLVSDAQEQLEALAESLPADITHEMTAVLGQPADVLCQLVETQQMDLVVIGTHGYEGLDRVLGTTAAKVVNRAPCSVMVVRNPEPPGPRAPLGAAGRFESSAKARSTDTLHSFDRTGRGAVPMHRPKGRP